MLHVLTFRHFPRRKKPSLRSNASISSAAKLPLYGNRSLSGLYEFLLSALFSDVRSS